MISSKVVIVNIKELVIYCNCCIFSLGTCERRKMTAMFVQEQVTMMEQLMCSVGDNNAGQVLRYISRATVKCHIQQISAWGNFQFFTQL